VNRLSTSLDVCDASRANCTCFNLQQVGDPTTSVTWLPACKISAELHVQHASCQYECLHSSLRLFDAPAHSLPCVALAWPAAFASNAEWSDSIHLFGRQEESSFACHSMVQGFCQWHWTSFTKVFKIGQSPSRTTPLLQYPVSGGTVLVVSSLVSIIRSQ
jgi:hypothetical protein